jgi:hypothetical protein
LAIKVDLAFGQLEEWAILVKDCITLCRRTARDAGADGQPKESSFRLREPQSGAAIVQIHSPETSFAA